MRTSKLNGIVFLLALLVLWECVAQAGWVNPLIVPPLSRILQVFYDLVSSGQIPLQIVASMKRAAAGYLLAALVFIPLGIAMGLWRRVDDFFAVIVEMLRPIPPPVVIPVALLFFGLEDSMKIFVIFFSCAWPILLNTLDGVRSVDPILLHTARTFGLSYGKTIWQVILPASAPQIMTGLRVSLPITLILVVISEMVGSTDGIGYFVLDAQRRFKVAQMYAGMLVLALLGYVLNVVFDWVYRNLLSWHVGSRKDES
ncbi:MAG: ABC transporter permease [Deltaproteobacteria bacterium]|nr:ABC transporter permease [Deltaproteobacteria bacterium]